MAITKNIVNMMGGTIEIKTQKNKGTEFIIRLMFRIQSELETKIEEMEKELTEEKVNAVDIKHFISLIRKCKEPTEISDLMFAELIDKIDICRLLVGTNSF